MADKKTLARKQSERLRGLVEEAIVVVREQRFVTRGGLASRLGIDPDDASRVIRRLEERGWLGRREPPPAIDTMDPAGREAVWRLHPKRGLGR